MTSSTTPSTSRLGDRFNPYEEELLNYYLPQKLLGNDHLVTRIPHLDIYQFDPWDLPWEDSNDRERHFFSPLQAKNPYKNNGKINRSTKTGSWQAKGKDRKIRSEDNGEEIGIRKIYVHSCIKDEIKYVMHEYSLQNQQSDMVVCKVKKNKVCKKRKPSKMRELSSKKVKKTENEKAEVLQNKDNCITSSSDKDSDIENRHTSDLEGQQYADSTCDNAGGKNCVPASDSVNHGTYFTIPGKVDLEIPPHPESFPSYNQQDYNPYFTVNDDQPLMITEQSYTNNGFAATSVSMQEEDSNIEKRIANEKSDLEDQYAGSTCDDAGGSGTNCLPTPDSGNHFTISEKVDLETPPHLQSFPGFDQLDYSHYFTLDSNQPLMIPEQVPHTNSNLPLMIPEQVPHPNNGPAGASVSRQEDDLFSGLESLWNIDYTIRNIC